MLTDKSLWSAGKPIVYTSRLIFSMIRGEFVQLYPCIHHILLRILGPASCKCISGYHSLFYSWVTADHLHESVRSWCLFAEVQVYPQIVGSMQECRKWHFGWNWVLYRYWKYIQKHTIQALHQVPTQTNDNFRAKIRCQKTKKTKEFWA